MPYEFHSLKHCSCVKEREREKFSSQLCRNFVIGLNRIGLITSKQIIEPISLYYDLRLNHNREMDSFVLGGFKFPTVK